uniref:Sterol O-acyltransferase 2 n=1 Tax=Callorhinchus milii TaxID=7868 RepID=A0A4W3IBK3_CALMI
MYNSQCVLLQKLKDQMEICVTELFSGTGLPSLWLFYPGQTLYPRLHQHEQRAVQYQGAHPLHIPRHPARYPHIPGTLALSLSASHSLSLSLCVFTLSHSVYLSVSLSLALTHPRSLALAGMFLLFLAFFSFLHCWLNAFAEMLRFGDRMFYKLTGKRCRVVAMLSVFGLSAVVHEYVLTLCLGYFYPVMFCLFAIFGVLFNFIFNDNRKSPAWNVLMWVFLFIGQGIQVCLYCQEWYAQIHCPVTQRTFWELVTPRSWTCRPKA